MINRPTNDEIEENNRHQAERVKAEHAAQWTPETNPNAPINSSAPQLGGEWVAWSTRHPGVIAWGDTKFAAHSKVSKIVSALETPVLNKRRTVPTGADFLALLERLGWERRLDMFGEPRIYTCPERADIVWTTPDDQPLDARALAVLANAAGLDLDDAEDLLGITARKLAKLAKPERDLHDRMFGADADSLARSAALARANADAYAAQAKEADEQAAVQRARVKAEAEALTRAVAEATQAAAERAAKRAAAGW